jgi:hypothetical protein
MMSAGGSKLGQYEEIFAAGVISSEDSSRIKTAIRGFFRRASPLNFGTIISASS